MSIHQRSTRIVVSVVAFLVVLFLIWPHLMDVHPPLFVRVLLMPAELVIRSNRGPCHNIGTPEHPICEGTPIDLLFGLMMLMLTVLLYPVITYLGLSLVSKFIKRREL